MNIQIYETFEALSRAVADVILRQVQHTPTSVLCLAAGDSPKRAYELLGGSKIAFSKCSFIGLDEWVGIPRENEGSCFYFLNQNLFQPLHIDTERVNLFDTLAKDPAEECLKMDSIVRAKGGIDLMLVGVGMNGHIGFNEPGVDENLYAHVIDLDDTTRSVGQKYFRQTTHLAKGMTLGFRHVLESKHVVLMASGRKKAPIIRNAFEGSISTDVPASIIRKHSNATIMIDRDAASLLTLV